MLQGNIGTGLAGPAAAGPMFGQPTRAKMVVQFLLQAVV